jgi:hypothetical protein
LHHKQPDFTRRFYVIPNEREESLRPLFLEFWSLATCGRLEQFQPDDVLSLPDTWAIILSFQGFLVATRNDMTWLLIFCRQVAGFLIVQF